MVCVQLWFPHNSASLCCTFGIYSDWLILELEDFCCYLFLTWSIYGLEFTLFWGFRFLPWGSYSYPPAYTGGSETTDRGSTPYIACYRMAK